MDSQLTDTVVMVRPDTFGFNPQTAATNEFQHVPDVSAASVRDKAQREFHAMAAVLRSHQVAVLTLPSPSGVVTPDAVFPNNWCSFHTGGKLVVYPMLAPNRRQEQQPASLKILLGDHGVVIKETIDLTIHEQEGKFLEGTGSLVLDRVNHVAYAVISPRTDASVVEAWAKKMGFTPVIFHAVDHIPVYHTNVVMSVGEGFVVVCFDVIANEKERLMIREKLTSTAHEVIALSVDQFHVFCGNILHLKTTDGKRIIVLSQTAHDAFTEDQKMKLQKFGELVPVSIPTIEQVGGGSARCMLAEVFA